MRVMRKNGSNRKRGRGEEGKDGNREKEDRNNE